MSDKRVNLESEGGKWLNRDSVATERVNLNTLSGQRVNLELEAGKWVDLYKEAGQWFNFDLVTARWSIMTQCQASESKPDSVGQSLLSTLPGGQSRLNSKQVGLSLLRGSSVHQFRLCGLISPDQPCLIIWPVCQFRLSGRSAGQTQLRGRQGGVY